MKVYTKRQMGVVYRAYKEGRIESDRHSINFAYRYSNVEADEILEHGEYQPAVKWVRGDISALIDAIINGPDEDIQPLFEAFMDSVRKVYEREREERKRLWNAQDAMVARVVAGVM